MKKHLLLMSVAIVAIGAKAPKGALPIGQPMTASDKSTGSKAHPQILEEFGGAYDAPQATYVRNIGQKIALQSGLSNNPNDFTVTLLDSPVNNAFTVPGGYIYITRQLLALMNNEAELASVMGHEVGHGAARHAQKRNKRSTLGGLGAAAATILGGVLAGSQGAQLGQQLGGTIATRWVMGYSRAQEYQADDLGVSYLAKSGYDPMAASSMLASLAAQTALDARVQGQAESNMPKWASSHPDPASRVVRASQKAGLSQPKGKALNTDAFIAQLDNMLYDDNPKQGVVDGQKFIHPDLKLQFVAPNGFAVTNGSSAVTINGSSGRAQFGGGTYAGDLNAYVGAVFKAVGGDSGTPNFGEVRKTTINGLPVGYASAQANSQSGPVTVTVYAYEFGKDRAYHILAITGTASSAAFDSLYQSVRRINDAEAAAVKPRRIDVVTVRSGDTVAKMAARMAYSTMQTERFLTLNGLKAGAALTPGRKVKLVVFGG